MKEPGYYKVEQPDGGDVQIMSLYPSSADTYRAAGWTVTPMSIVPTADLEALREAAKAVLASGKRSFDHPAIHYDEWQVDHDDENALRAALSRFTKPEAE